MGFLFGYWLWFDNAHHPELVEGPAVGFFDINNHAHPKTTFRFHAQPARSPGPNLFHSF